MWRNISVMAQQLVAPDPEEADDIRRPDDGPPIEEEEEEMQHRYYHDRGNHYPLMESLRTPPTITGWEEDDLDVEDEFETSTKNTTMEEEGLVDGNDAQPWCSSAQNDGPLDKDDHTVSSNGWNTEDIDVENATEGIDYNTCAASEVPIQQGEIEEKHWLEHTNRIDDGKIYALPSENVKENNHETKDVTSGWEDDDEHIFWEEEGDTHATSPEMDHDGDGRGSMTGGRSGISHPSSSLPVQPRPPEHPPASTVAPPQQLITSLQIQHEQDLQKQYTIIDQKSSIIQALENKCWQLEQDFLKQNTTLQNELETLASELISTVQERDMLLSSLQNNVATIQQLQDQIEQVGFNQNEKYQHIIHENVSLQEQISRYVLDMELIQQTLHETQLENQQLQQQVQHVTLEAKAYQDRYSTLQLESAKLKTDLEQRDIGRSQDLNIADNNHVTNLQKDNDLLRIELQTIEEKSAHEKKVLMDTHVEEQKELRNQLAATRHENESLLSQVEKLRTDMDVEKATAIQMNEQMNIMQNRLMQLQKEMELLQSSTEHEKQVLIQQQNEECNMMQTKIHSMEIDLMSVQSKYEDLERHQNTATLPAVDASDSLEILTTIQSENASLKTQLEQLEKTHAIQENDFQDVVHNLESAMDEKMQLQNECDHLRQRIIQLEQDVVSYKQSIAEHDRYVEEQAKWYEDEINQLRQEISTLRSSALHTAVDFNESINFKSVQNNDNFVRAEEIQLLQTECEHLRGEIQIRDERVVKLMDECQNLREASSKPLPHPEETQSLEPPELEIIRSRLKVALEERDTLSVENEELLVQFGYMKQKMDSADEYILSLQEEIKSLQIQLENVDLEELSGRSERTMLSRNSDLDKHIQMLTMQKNELESRYHEQQKQIEEYSSLQSNRMKSNEDFAVIQAKLTYLEAQCKAKDQTIETKDSQIHALTEQIESSVMDLVEPDDVDVSVCREKIHELEAKCESLSIELDSVKSQLETTEGALNAKEQLYSIQSAVYDLESSVPFHGDTSRFVHESEAHIRDLQKELNGKSKIVEELQGSVMNLKFQLDDHDTTKDIVIEIAKKDEEIQALNKQVESIQAKLLSTEEQLKRLLATETGMSAYNHIKEMDYLRSNIVSVARALERSETNRADAIGRLVSEREAHILQLRSMSEKLKRFYSAVTFGHV